MSLDSTPPAPHQRSALVHYRLRAGLSQAEVARATSTNRVTVSRWENGASVPTLLKGLRLAEVLGADPFELFLGRRHDKQARRKKKHTIPSS